MNKQTDRQTRLSIVHVRHTHIQQHFDHSRSLEAETGNPVVATSDRDVTCILKSSNICIGRIPQHDMHKHTFRSVIMSVCIFMCQYISMILCALAVHYNVPEEQLYTRTHIITAKTP